MTWTAAADAVMPGCARAAAACPPTADTETSRIAIAATVLACPRPVQRAACGRSGVQDVAHGPGAIRGACRSGRPRCGHHRVRADLATLGWPSDPGRDVL